MTEKKSSKTVWIIVAVAAVVLCIPCTGMVAAIGIPAFIGYVRRSKTSEASGNLNALFRSAKSYYAREFAGPSGLVSQCTVDPATTPNPPGRTKTMPGPLPASFDALGFVFSEPVYYQYEIVSTGGCGHSANEPLYSLRAHGDLDGDGEQSLFELSVGSDPDNELFHARGFYIDHETE